jgi:AraC-like DNA-binding protein
MTKEWDLKRFVRRRYELSESRPLEVTVKLHPGASEERFDMHYALELGIVLRGRMERIHHQHRRTVSTGQVWFCGAWEPHGWRVAAGPCQAVVLTIFPPMLANTTFPETASFDWMAPFTSPAEERPEVLDAVRGEIRRLAHELTRSTDMPPSRQSLMQRMLLYQLLLYLPQAKRAAAHPRSLPSDSYGQINRAIELVLRRRSYVTCDEAARACALSPKRLNRLFEKGMGVSFPKFSLRYRLQGAATQLLESRDPIKAIAREWGFADESHLHACFRAAYGCSPGQYRRGGWPSGKPTK